MKVFKAIGAILLIIATAFYLITGVVFDEGGDQLHFVIKPHPMIQASFGGGEEGRWRREHPGQPEPWWYRGEYRSLATYTLEAPWELPYFAGHLLLEVSWLVVVGIWLKRLFWRSIVKSTAVSA